MTNNTNNVTLKEKIQAVWRYVRDWSLHQKLLKQIPTEFWVAQAYPTPAVNRYTVTEYEPHLYSEYNDAGILLVGYDTKGNKSAIFAKIRNKQWCLYAENYYWTYADASYYLMKRYTTWKVPTEYHYDWYKLINTFPEKFI